MLVNFGLNGKRADLDELGSFSSQILGVLYKWPIKGSTDQSFEPAAVSQLKVSTPCVGFVALLLLSPQIKVN